MLEDEENAANSSLDAVKAEIAGQGVTVTSEVMIGTAVAVIGELHAPGDVVVMSSHGRSGIGRWLMGSVAERLVREGTAPVIVVPAADRVRCTRRTGDGRPAGGCLRRLAGAHPDASVGFLAMRVWRTLLGIQRSTGSKRNCNRSPGTVRRARSGRLA